MGAGLALVEASTMFMFMFKVEEAASSPPKCFGQDALFFVRTCFRVIRWLTLTVKVRTNRKNCVWSGATARTTVLLVLCTGQSNQNDQKIRKLFFFVFFVGDCFRWGLRTQENQKRNVHLAANL